VDLTSAEERSAPLQPSRRFGDRHDLVWAGLTL
jgi:hypothetical protein